MKKFYLLPALALCAVGCALGAAELPPPEIPDDRPQLRERGDFRNRQECPMMKRDQRQGSKRDARMGKHCGQQERMMPRVPMNEDEMAKFALLRMAIRDAQEDYRADASEKNLAALRTAIEQMVTAQQQFEIERCEKALARAKAAVERKDKIVDRQLKRMTAKPDPKAPVPPPAK